MKKRTGLSSFALSTFALLVLGAFLFASCGQQESAVIVPVFAVETATATPGSFENHITFSGDIVAGSTIDIFPEVAGRVSRIYADVGSRVFPGSPIVAVDPSRPGMLFNHHVASSPIAGMVVAVPAQVGAMVSQAVPLARISTSDALVIKIHVPERFVYRLALNLSAEITLDAWPGRLLQGTVSEISPVISPTSRTVEVTVRVPDQDGILMEGMFARVRLITEQRENVITVPSSSIIQRFGESYVYVVLFEPVEASTEEAPAAQGGLFRRRPAEAEPVDRPTHQFVARRRIVQTGIVVDGVVEIISGLNPGDDFVVGGQSMISDGALVNVIGRVLPPGVVQ